MTLKNVSAVVGLAIAILFHVLYVSNLGAAFAFPGLIAHLLITGLHGGDGLLDAIATLAEILITAAFYAFLIYALVRLTRMARGTN
jgi:hypothetical protein